MLQYAVLPTSTNPLGLPEVNAPVTIEMTCPRCGYNLRGLKTGNPCPECGTTIRGFRRGFSGDSVNDVSPDFLRLLAGGAFVMLCGLPLMIIGVAWTLHEGPAGSLFHPACGVMLLGSAAWGGGLWCSHTPRPGATEEIRPGDNGEPRPEGWRLRLWNRCSQSLWLLGGVAIWGAGTLIGSGPIPPVARFLGLTGLLSLLMAAGTLITVGIYLANIAEWAYDTTTAQRLRSGPIIALIAGTPLGILAYALLSVLISNGVGPLSLMAFGVVLVVFGLSMMPMCLGLLGFTNMAAWAVKNRNEAFASDRRRAAKIVQRIEEGQRPRKRGEGGTV